MQVEGLKELIASGSLRAAPGPVAAIIAEDEAEVAATFRHHADKGFRTLLLFAPRDLTPDGPLPDGVIRVDFPTRAPDTAPTIVNALVDALPPRTWLYYGYNAEFLFYPFAETRSVGEMLAFHAEERRDAMLTYVIDLYAGDLSGADDAVSLTDAFPAALRKTLDYHLGRPSQELEA